LLEQLNQQAKSKEQLRLQRLRFLRNLKLPRSAVAI
jgi:hypothetical protein